MTVGSTQNTTQEWYQEYFAKKGTDRNDPFNPGVLFQIFAVQKSVVEALRLLPVQRDKWKVLDVGCGSGTSLSHLVSLGFVPASLHGVDIQEERIVAAKNRFPGISFKLGDASRMDYASDSFDLVMETTMFIQLTDESLSQTVANEMLRVLKPAGYVMLIDWRYSYGRSEYKALSTHRIAKLFGVGSRTRTVCGTRGALVPPISRPVSSRVSSLYFAIARTLPFLVGQVTTVLQRIR